MAHEAEVDQQIAAALGQLELVLAQQLHDMLLWKAEVRSLGHRIGYGNMMHLAQQCWEEASANDGSPAGGAFVYGPCLATTVPCGCSGSCDWCCGSGRLTRKVAALKHRRRKRR